MCGDEPIERATAVAFANAGQASGRSGDPILHAYRVVSGLNGEVPKGQALFTAIDLPVFVKAVAEMTPEQARAYPVDAAAGGRNPTGSEKVLAVVRHIWDLEKSGLTHNQTLGALDLVLAINNHMPYIAGAVTVVMLQAAESAKNHYGSANYFTDQFEKMASMLWTTDDAYGAALKEAAPSSLGEPVTL